VILNGDGSNGKSVFMDVIKELFSPEVIRSLKPHEWNQRFSTAQLDGCKINIVNEVPSIDIAGGDTFKSVISGNRQKAERKGKDPYDFKPDAGHMFACNKLPGTNDQSHGFWRRWLVIMFWVIFDERNRDVDLRSRLITPEELQGIATMAINAAVRLLSRGGFDVPNSSESAKLEWMIESDQVMQFLRQCCDHCHLKHNALCADADGKCKITGLPVDDRKGLCSGDGCPEHGSVDAEDVPDLIYPTYREWSKAIGHKALASQNLSSRLRSLGYQKRNTKGRWFNLSVKPESERKYKSERLKGQ
jgi:phage/plasmid-associated DNA primase